VCVYNALAVLKDRVLVFPELCHDCGGCALFCPENAIGKKEHAIGFVESGYAGTIEFFQGTLTPGEAFAPPIIRALKRKMSDSSIVIADAPPGTSCPVVEAIQGSDYCLLVAEPTPFGLRDLTLAVQLLRKLQLQVGVVINRSDVGDNKVEAFCAQEGLPVMMKLPYDKQLAIKYAEGTPAVAVFPTYNEKFSHLYADIKALTQL
jgi:MinD superfamily P-loop ATPase